MKDKRFEQVKLHFTERKLIDLIRRMGAGVITIKAQDGLPMVAEIHDKKKIVLNRETGNE